MTLTRPATLAALALCGAVSIARAQAPAKGIEFGMDASLSRTSYGDDGGSMTALQIPLQSVRLGIGLSPSISIEPTLGLATVSDHGTTTQLAFDVGLPIDIAHEPDGKQWFVRPLVGLLSASGLGHSSHQGSLGAGVGLRVPLITHVMSRFEARYRHGFDNGDFLSSNQVSLLAGISIVSR